ncbi:MAG: putative phage abortive infection protein [Solibacillus sp.]
MNEKNAISGAIIGVMTIIIISLILFIVDLDIGIINVISLITLDAFIIWIYFKFINFDREELKMNFLFKRENILLIFGLIIILVAVSTPFMIMWTNNYEYNLSFFEELGPIGDFFGGTTVGLLSLASLMFVTAAMFMQKEELELQRKEVTATRKEYEITNSTMKKQSFDSTFFNMINLHQSILNQVKYEKKSEVYLGRDVFNVIYKDLKFKVKLKKNAVLRRIYSDYLYNNIETRMKFIEGFFIKEEITPIRTLFIEEFEVLCSEKPMSWELELLKKLLNNFSENKNELLINRNNDYIFKLLINRIISTEEIISSEEKSALFNNLPIQYKKEFYEDFYSDSEDIIGHYYRNLYRIVKYIQDYKFTENEEENKSLQKEYRGILRAQLSSYELMMLFYNICYSEKGEKFKCLLENTDFFDDHLIEETFIWDDDREQLNFFKII